MSTKRGLATKLIAAQNSSGLPCPDFTQYESMYSNSIHQNKN